ncbi:MAG: SCO6745 family protein [Acidimicrobiia bacterium]
MSEAHLDAVRAAAAPIGAIGANFMLHPETFARSESHGYPHPFAGYFAGRGGVLGDVDSSVIAAVFTVFEPGVVKMFWEQGQPVHGAAEGARLYYDQMAQWARDHLAGASGLDRLVELGERVIDAAPVGGLPLFAGWKVMPRASDVPARAMQVLFVLRELRGSVHLGALAASGLGPVEAHLLNKGPEYAQQFGFSEPFPEYNHLKGLREQVEETTNLRMAEIVARALTPAEASELADLAASAERSAAG